MLIRCSDDCKFQEDGYCGLKNIYSAEVSMNTEEVDYSGCVYYKKKQKKHEPDSKRSDNYNYYS